LKGKDEPIMGNHISANAPYAAHLPTVMLVCRRNAIQSQMAEVLLRHYAGDYFNIQSAGISSGQIHPLTIATLEEIGMDMYGKKAVLLNQSAMCTVDYLIVCDDSAQADGVTLPKAAQYLEWSFDDPSAIDGSQAEQFQSFRQVRDQIHAQVRRWLIDQHMAIPAI